MGGASVSGDALVAWWALSEEAWRRLEMARLAIPEKRRPSQHVVDLVGGIIASYVIEGKGYADPTYVQIADRSHTMCVDTIKHALQVFDTAGVLRTIRKSCAGEKNNTGRAPRRVFAFYDPEGHLSSTMDVQAVPIDVEVHKSCRDQMPQTSPENSEVGSLQEQLIHWRSQEESSTNSIQKNLAIRRIETIENQMKLSASE